MAHPLLNRRDITAERTAAVTGQHPEQHPEQHPHSIHAEIAAAAESLAYIDGCLRRLLTQERADITQLCVTDRDVAEGAMENFPVAGAKRLIVRRTGDGNSVTLAANAPQLLITARESRIGGQIVNLGTGSVTLYLTRYELEPGGGVPLVGGTPQIGLLAGAAWDFQLSRALWCGAVIAVAGTGGAVVTVAEV